MRIQIYLLYAMSRVAAFASRCQRNRVCASLVLLLPCQDHPIEILHEVAPDQVRALELMLSCTDGHHNSTHPYALDCVLIAGALFSAADEFRQDLLPQRKKFYQNKKPPVFLLTSCWFFDSCSAKLTSADWVCLWPSRSLTTISGDCRSCSGGWQQTCRFEGQTNE